MRRALLTGLFLLALAGCKKEAAKPIEDEGSGPQIATSLDDADLPVDRSDQVSAIDAATGDAHGMPKDGGSVVRTPKPEARPAVEASAASNGAEAPVTTAPLVTPPPPPTSTTPAPPPAGN